MPVLVSDKHIGADLVGRGVLALLGDVKAEALGDTKRGRTVVPVPAGQGDAMGGKGGGVWSRVSKHGTCSGSVSVYPDLWVQRHTGLSTYSHLTNPAPLPD